MGTKFNPLKFSLDTKTKRMFICGCKLSTEAPFCDGMTCQKIIKGEKFEAKEDILYLDEDSEQNEGEYAAIPSNKNI